MKLWIDFETYSDINIKLNGGYRYCTDLSTAVLCLGWAINDEPVQIWIPGNPFPDEAIQAINEGCQIFAHNALFDYRIWNNVLCRDFPAIPKISIFNVTDTAGLSASFSLPLGLANAGEAMSIKLPKDIKGAMLVKLLCTPNKEGERPIPNSIELKSKFNELYDYCGRDVDAMREFVQSLPRDNMTPQEARIWCLTQRMNTRGLPVAYDEVQAIKTYLDDYIKKSMAQVAVLTTMPVISSKLESTVNPEVPTEMKPVATTINQIAKIKDWCLRQGYPILDMQAITIEQCLADDQCPPKVRKILQLRQELGRTSTAKYRKVLELACPGRLDSYWVHDNLVYHGAAPGRWTGRGFQMQNLPRASVPNPEEVIAQFKAGALVVDPVTKGKALIRPMIKAPKGYSIIVSDYSSIENRVLHWLAGDVEELESFRNGLDQYKTMASALYEVPYDAVDNDQRKMGKVIILGCIAEGTLVLTQEGPVPIEKIRLDHKLWDGSKWVTHQGLLYKGKKQCVNFAGAWMTPDHEIYFGEQKEEVWRHQDSIQSEKRAICSAFRQFLNTYRDEILRKPVTVTELNAPYAGNLTIILWETLKEAIPLNIVNAGDEQNINLIWSLVQKLQDTANKLLTELTAYGTPLNLGVILRKTELLSGTGPEELKYGVNGSQILTLLLNMLCGSQVAKLQDSNSIESTTTEIMNQGTSDSLPTERTYSTHDILNAGNLHRFTIITPKGALICANCGYMMGAETFRKTAKLQFRMKLTEKRSKESVAAYREKYPLVVALWTGLKTAAIKTVISGQKHTYGLITFGTATVNGTRWLAMQLPNDKCIYYKNPAVEQKFIPKYENMGRIPTVTHEGWNGYSRKWTRLALTPGRITENADQGTAREMMATGLLSIQDQMKEVQLIGTVHDEGLGLIKNSDIRSDTMEKFNTLMCDIPWAGNFPIKAKGYIATRYRKE